MNIEIKLGKLCGQKNVTTNGCEFHSFEGIPYAKPPVGNLRFKAPQEPLPWDGIKEVTKSRAGCYSWDVVTRTIEGSEDCLYLNVYTPINNEAKITGRKPVMVWITGGAFISGSGERRHFGPDYLMEKDVVLVTLNYRLGALGFLVLNDPQLNVTGNAGLKDIVMALKWVQQYISSFQGDPNNVTIFGGSAGAAAVGYLMLSPMCTGLFHKAIMQSGSPLCGWAKGNPNCATELAKYLGKTPTDDSDLLNILQSASKEEILQAQIEMGDEWRPSVQRWFSPVVECGNSNNEAFILDEPINLLKTGNYNKIPVIIGITSNEGLLLEIIALKNDIVMYPTSEEELIPVQFGMQEGSEESKECAKKIREFYYGKNVIVSDRRTWLRYLSDAFIIRGCIEFAENILQTSEQNVYLFKLDCYSKLGNFGSTGIVANGACHGEELFYLFKSENVSEVEANSHDAITIQRMTTWWTNFAKYSNPNGPKYEIEWPSITQSNLKYMYIGEESSVEDNLEKKMNDFWKSIETI